MNKNLFRKDLYFRLNVVPITVPPLRERKEEIPALAAQFVRQFNQKYELNKSLDPKVIDKLIAYNWPGNIRELENVIERTLVTHSGDIIDDVALPDDSLSLIHIFRGATPHFEYVSAEVTKGVAQVALNTGVPVIYGVITADTIEQAIERAGTCLLYTSRCV